MNEFRCQCRFNSAATSGTRAATRCTTSYVHTYINMVHILYMYAGHMHVHTYACRVPAPWAFYHASCVGSAKGIVNLHVQRQKFLLKTRFMLSETAAAAATRATELTKLRRLNPLPSGTLATTTPPHPHSLGKPLPALNFLAATFIAFHLQFVTPTSTPDHWQRPHFFKPPTLFILLPSFRVSLVHPLRSTSLGLNYISTPLP